VIEFLLSSIIHQQGEKRMEYLFKFQLSEQDADRLLNILSDYRMANEVQAMMIESSPDNDLQALAVAYRQYEADATALIDKILAGRRQIKGD